MSAPPPCPTDSHDPPVPGVVVGSLRASWWPEDRTDRPAFCARCAALAEFVGIFTPDPPAA